MKQTSICAYITSPHNTHAHTQVLDAVQAALDSNMTINGVFFHDQAVSLANPTAHTHYLHVQWRELAKEHNIPLYACINSLKQQQLSTTDAAPFIVGSLGDLVELQATSALMLTEQRLSLNTHQQLTPPSHLFVFEQAPYQNSFTQSGIDNLFAHASLGCHCQVLLLNDGINVAIAHEAPASVKNTAKQLSALPLYDVTDVFMHSTNSHNLADFKPIDVDALANIMHNASFIFHY